MRNKYQILLMITMWYRIIDTNCKVLDWLKNSYLIDQLNVLNINNIGMI
jgi:hypothetical protein